VFDLAVVCTAEYPETLKSAFQNKGITLSESATIQRNSEGWVITDGGQKFTVRMQVTPVSSINVYSASRTSKIS
jgi:hydrogenase maturation factor HypE